MKKIISVMLLLSLCLFSLASCGGKDYCEYARTREVSADKVAYVEMSVKDYGRVVILIDKVAAPITAANFLKLVGEGFYDGLTFHRVIKNFMIQGGDPKADGTGGSGTNIYGEFYYNGWTGNSDLHHVRGVISMARGTKYNSASSQFFICNDDARASLDGQYAAFGYVMEGMSVVDKITGKTAPKDEALNGAVERSEQAVIEYIKVLDSYTHEKN